MNKFIPLFLILFTYVFALFNGTTYANSNNKTRTIEEQYTELGYVSVDEAIRDFEKHYKQDLELPLRVPPIPFTHIFGRFNNLEGSQNDSFEMEFISEDSSELHFFIDVRLAKNGIHLNDRDVEKVFKLKNGEIASYINVRGANVFVFKRDKWQYLFSVNQRISDKVTPEELVQIANSIEHSTQLSEEFFN
ncbi:hypothetical protein [Ferdinandcohnia sp. Marseille-Q9671]